MVASVVGTVPNTFAYVYVGSLLDSIGELLAGGRPAFDARSSTLLAIAICWSPTSRSPSSFVA